MNIYFRCLESRIDKNNTLYGKFNLTSISSGQGNTFANALRRSLFSDLSGLAITHFCITSSPSLGYEFATIPGLAESLLDFSLNLKRVVLTGRLTGALSTCYKQQVEKEDILSPKVTSSPKSTPLPLYPFTPLFLPLLYPFGVRTHRRQIGVAFVEGDKMQSLWKPKVKKGMGCVQLKGTSHSPFESKIGGIKEKLKTRCLPESKADRESESKNSNLRSKENKKYNVQNFPPLAPIGFLKAKGPAVLRARDLILPPGIRCVHPDQYLGTLAADSALSIKFLIAAGKGYIVQDETFYKSLSRAKLLLSFRNSKNSIFSTSSPSLPLRTPHFRRRRSPVLPSVSYAQRAHEVLPKLSLHAGTPQKGKEGINKRVKPVLSYLHFLRKPLFTFYPSELRFPETKGVLSSAFPATCACAYVSPYVPPSLPPSGVRVITEGDRVEGERVILPSVSKGDRVILPSVSLHRRCTGIRTSVGGKRRGKERVNKGVNPLGIKYKTDKKWDKGKTTGITFDDSNESKIYSVAKNSNQRGKRSSVPLLQRGTPKGQRGKSIGAKKKIEQYRYKEDKTGKEGCRILFQRSINQKQASPLLNDNEKLSRKQLIWGSEDKFHPVLPLDATFTPISKVNFQIDIDRNTEKSEETIVLEIWTNGSITPKRAIQESCLSLAQDFYSLFSSVNGFSNLHSWWKRESLQFYPTHLS